MSIKDVLHIQYNKWIYVMKNVKPNKINMYKVINFPDNQSGFNNSSYLCYLESDTSDCPRQKFISFLETSWREVKGTAIYILLFDSGNKKVSNLFLFDCLYHALKFN